MSFSPGDVFAGYTIVRRLGAGGMGEVSLAQHPRLPRRDAIKVLPPHLASDDAFRLRFLREADLAAGLNHPNIVGVLDRGEEDGRLWLSMPYVDGIDAAARLARFPGGLPLDEVQAIVRDTAAALDFAHQRGVLHRDVKPANIMLDGSRALLADFGIARAAGDDSDLTATGTAIGSVAYAAPEQLRGDPVGPVADVYSLAATAYALLTGVRPFDRSTPAAIVAAALEGQVPSVVTTRSDLPTALDGVLARGMARAPEDRPMSAGAFAAELHHAGIAPTSIPSPPADDRYDPTLLAPATTPAPTPASSPTTSEATSAFRNGASRRRWVLPVAVAAAVLVGTVATVALLGRTAGSADDAAQVQPGPSAVTSSTGTPVIVTAAPSTVTVQPSMPAPAPAQRSSFDLGLAKPVSKPPCDGRYIVALVSIEASNPSLRTLISDRLSAEPAAQYFYSGALDCSSINAVDANGERFYTPYLDYGSDLAAACYATQHRDGAYVRTLRAGVPIGTDPCG